MPSLQLKTRERVLNISSSSAVGAIGVSNKMLRTIIQHIVLIQITIIIAPPVALAADSTAAGFDLIKQERRPQALSFFQSLIAKEPKNASAYLGLCCAYSAMEQPGKAYEAIQKAFALNPTPNDAKFYQTRAQNYLLMVRAKDALPDVQRAIKIDGLTAQNHRQMAAYFLAISNMKKANEEWISAKRLEPANADNTALGVSIRLAQNQLPQALAEANALVKIEPKSGRSYRNRAWVLQAGKQYPAAIRDLDKCLEINRQDANAMAIRGMVFLDQGKPREALSQLKRATKETPWLHSVWTCTAAAMAKSIDSAEAIEYASKGIELNPFSEYGYMTRGALYRDTGDWALALKDFSKAVDLGQIYALTPKGEMLESVGRHAEAIETLTASIKVMPPPERPYVERATIFEKLNRMKEAEADYDKACEIAKGGSMTTLEHRGVFYYKIGKYQKAVDDLSIVLQQKPQTVRARQYRLEAYEKLGKKELAKRDRDELKNVSDLFETFNKADGSFTTLRKKLGDSPNK